jgi:ABC-type polysaccharide/polyol phosphate export permease
MAAVAIAATILDGILPMFTIERGAAVLAFLFVSSANRLAILLSRAVIHLVNGWVSVAISLLFAGAILKLDFSRVDWVTLSAAILAISLSSTAFALFAGNFSLLLREWTDLSALLQGSVVAFSGAVIPVARLPGLIGAIGHALPLTAGLVAFRAAFQGAPVGAVVAPLVGEATVALAYAALSALMFAAVEGHAKRMGSLDWEAA